MIKTVRIIELSFDEQKSAINEVKILAALDSPFVVKYFDSFIDTDSLHIVMEFCNKGDLQTLLKKAKSRSLNCLQESITWNIGLQVVLGLHYLHTKRTLHRDLKTANVFLTRPRDSNQKTYDVKIGDLGVAKLLETSTAFAQTIVGTPYYLSPELCADKPYRDKSDCWALGVMLYECCTLAHPFEARNQCALILKIIQEPPTELPPGVVSNELATLISWLLEKDPAKRPTIKQILGEKFVQKKLREVYEDSGGLEKFLLPPELGSSKVTNKLGNSGNVDDSGDVDTEDEEDDEFDGGRTDREQRTINQWQTLQPREFFYPTFGNHRPGRHVQQTIIREGADNNGVISISSNPSLQSNSDKVNKDRTSPTPSSSSSEKSNNYNSNNSGHATQMDKVRGNRVRGGVSRQPSSKARERYQIRPSVAPLKESSLSSTPPTEKEDSDQSGTFVRHIEVKGAFAKYEPPENKLGISVDPVLDYSNFIQLTADEKIGEFKDENHRVVDSKETADYINRETEDYEVDFESDDDFNELNNSDSNLRQKRRDESKCEGDIDELASTITAALPGSPLKEAMNILSSENTLRDTLGKSLKQSGSPSADCSDEADENGETIVDPQKLVESLEVLIVESRNKSIASLGKSLFDKVYRLCADSMVVQNSSSGDKRDEEITAKKNARLLKELEHALCDQLKGGLEVACDAVFSVKVLLALEDKLSSVKNEAITTTSSS